MERLYVLLDVRSRIFDFFIFFLPFSAIFVPKKGNFSTDFRPKMTEKLKIQKSEVLRLKVHIISPTCPNFRFTACFILQKANFSRILYKSIKSSTFSIKPLYFRYFKIEFLESEKRFFNSIKSIWFVSISSLIWTKHAKIPLDPPYHLNWVITPSLSLLLV